MPGLCATCRRWSSGRGSTTSCRRTRKPRRLPPPASAESRASPRRTAARERRPWRGCTRTTESFAASFAPDVGQTCGRMAAPRRADTLDRDSPRRELDEALESAPEHAHPIERHFLWIHHRLHARVFHYLGVHAVTVLARVIEDPRKHDHLVVLELHTLWKGRDLARLNVVADTFPVLTCAMFDPDLAGFARHPPVSVKVAMRHRYNEAIDVVRHLVLLGWWFCFEFASAAGVPRQHGRSFKPAPALFNRVGQAVGAPRYFAASSAGGNLFNFSPPTLP